MTKSASIAIICVICAIALFFGVCSCLPVMDYGKYDVYHSAISLIQGDSMFSDSVVAIYDVMLDEETDATPADIASAISARLSNIYGRYFSQVTVLENNQLSVKVSKTANSEKASVASILNSVTATGKVELVSSQSYSADSVILDYTHISSCKPERYTDGNRTYYIVSMKLNKAGNAIAASKLSTSGEYYLAVDGSVRYGVRFGSDDKLQVYTSGDLDSASVAGLTRSGALAATLQQRDMEDVSCIGGLVFGIIVAAIIVGSWIFYAVRYKLLAVPAIVSQLLAVVVFIMFAGLVYFNLLNIASAIGIILGYGLMSVFTCLVLEKIKDNRAEKTYRSARYTAFKANNKWNLIVHAIVLVVGIICWLIPTGVTAPLGNALVYCAVLSFGVTMGLNRLFTSFNLGFDANEDMAKSRQ